ncbi:MAG TPA: hypothetical protein VHO67_13840, partial [Polyangia bacterium]|nr:hypothetical protein [Polyangia bacterium]
PGGAAGGMAGAGGTAGVPGSAGAAGSAVAAGGNGGGAGAAGGGGPNVAFVTSQVYSRAELAALGSGTGATAVLAGADRACAAAAAGPGSLVPAGTYVAWISSRSQDALGRLAAARGGVPPRGWRRVDGRPFVDQIPLGSVPHTFYPIGLTEKGQPPSAIWAWTATTNAQHSIPLYDCQDWTSSASTDNAEVGLPTAGGYNWSGGIGESCSLSLPVICLQVDYAVPVVAPAPPANAKWAFFSYPFSTSSGLAGADALCAKDAAFAGLSGTFRALLATSTASAASRFHLTNTRPFVRLDGVIVAAIDGDLFQAPPKMLAPINEDVYGDFSASSTYVGAPGLTQIGTQTCSDWSTTSSHGVLGAANFTGVAAFNGFTDVCTRDGGIVCLEDSPAPRSAGFH